MDSAAQGVVTLNEATIQAIAQAVMAELWKRDLDLLLEDLSKGADGIAQALRTSGVGMDQAAECPNCGEDKYRGAHVHPDCFNYGVPLSYVCRPQPAPPELAKVECPNCGEMTERSHSRYEGPGPDKWACQPAPPEPAAREMPEAVRDAVDTLRSGVPSYPTWRQYADTLESWWRNLAQPVAGIDLTAGESRAYLRGFTAGEHSALQPAAQPVAVGMTEELRMILDVAESRAEDQRHDGLLGCSRNLERAIAAVRQQAAQGRKVELGKVRDYFNTPSALRTVGDERAALAELDAAEGKGEVSRG